jgi:hypothetical protein
MNELSFDYSTGFTIYAARFQPDGNVFVSDGSADEAWATADSYDVVMTEDGVGGHYTGSFDTSSNIGAGVYPVAVYLQAGGSPANSDTPLGRGIMYWDGEAEENIATIGDQMDNLSAQKSQVLNVYEE